MQNKLVGGLALGAILLVGAFLWHREGNQSVAEKKPDNQARLSVVTSFYPLYFFSQQIAGSKADVVNITPAGAEPHDYEPTSQDIARIERSSLLILNGGGLEPWSEDLEKNIDSQHTKIIVAGEGLTTGQMVEDGETMTDPHVWLSPVLAQKMVDKIAQGFIQADPVNKSFYQSNADTLKSKLIALDNTYKQGLSTCKEKNIITSHAAFGYLAQAYGLKQVPIAGLSPEAEPSTKELGDIVAFAKANNVNTIFFEALVSPKLAQTIATEVGAKTLVLNPIEGLSDEEVSSGSSYLTEMQSNLTNLRTALQCN